MPKCQHCGQESAHELDYCPSCGKEMDDSNKQRKIRQFKWWFVAIVIFCAVMMAYLPR
ncbi:MAG: hypothetical protein WAO12_03055 [Venatoribacter sp.]